MASIDQHSKKQKISQKIFYEPSEKIMRIIISAFLIFFAGWTLSANISVFLGLNLKALLLIAPFVIIILFVVYIKMPQIKISNLRDIEIPWLLCSWTNNKHVFAITLVALFIIPFFVYWSWIAFWILSLFLLTLCLLRRDTEISKKSVKRIPITSKSDLFIVALITIVAIILSYALTRSDLDDAFYVAISAFTSSNPDHALLVTDPMLGEPGFPLIFQSYRFASFELLSGAVAYLITIPAMDVYYIYLVPLWMIAASTANFLLCKELIPKHWLLAGIVTFLLALLLGEMSRSQANFSFVRIFQGKAVLLSVIVPTIFYLTARLFSKRGNNTDIYLLACCQITAIGLSNFGMLAAPMVGFGALLSNIPLALKGGVKKIYYAFALLFIPLPYLIYVALQSRGSPIMSFGTETAENVWVTVFGSHQQYLVAILLLAGPVLAKDNITRWRLGVPSLLLFAIYLNPWLSKFISTYVTTPPVYWRVVWSFPVLVFAAVAFCMLATGLFERRTSRLRLIPGIFFAAVLALMLYSLPFNTVRPGNIDPYTGFAAWKIPRAHLVVAQHAITDSMGGRLLAPEEIAGVISRFERHPRLVSTREMYLDMLRPAIGETEYTTRRILSDFVAGNNGGNNGSIRAALRALDVSVVVMNTNNETASVIDFLKSEEYLRRENLDGYSIWTKSQ